MTDNKQGCLNRAALLLTLVGFLAHGFYKGTSRHGHLDVEICRKKMIVKICKGC